jgi:hypothetical protein
MMFQFLSGRRQLTTSTPSDLAEEVELPWDGESSAERGGGTQDGNQYVAPERSVSPLPSSSVCCVIRACVAFHDAHSALAAAADSGIESCPELREQRNKAFGEVRSFPAQTKEAVHAKKQVLDLMAEWFSIEDANVAAFSFEVLTEALALLEGDAAHGCSCHHIHGATQPPEGRSPERRNPLSWFTRPRADTTDAPFAN